jgi:hypothetical protein
MIVMVEEVSIILLFFLIFNPFCLKEIDLEINKIIQIQVLEISKVRIYEHLFFFL